MKTNARRKYWNPRVEEKLGTGELDPLRLRRLKKALIYFKEKSPFYRRRFKRARFNPEKINRFSDMKHLPPLTKEDIRESQNESMERSGHPYGAHLTIGQEEIRLLAATSGTTGEPTFYVFGERDLEQWCEIRSRQLWRTGLRPGDSIMIAFGLGMFVGGVPNVIAARHFGLQCVPVGAEGGSGKVLRFMRLTRPRAMLATPSLAKLLVEKSREDGGETVDRLGMDRLILGGETGAGVPEVRKFLTENYNAEVFDLQGPNISCRLKEYAGMHRVGEDHYLYEIVEPRTGEPLPNEDGVEGEVLITHLFGSAAPFVRYAPGDVHRIYLSPCRCGMSGSRTMIVGRTDDMLKVKGVIVYPSAVADVVASAGKKITGEFRIVLKEKPPLVTDTLKIMVEAGKKLPHGKWGDLAGELKRLLKGKTGVTSDVDVVAPGTFTRSGHKTGVFIKEYED
ncbi:MAG: phenylacetate--CoA ligase family protein [bacterium]